MSMWQRQRKPAQSPRSEKTTPVVCCDLERKKAMINKTRGGRINIKPELSFPVNIRTSAPAYEAYSVFCTQQKGWYGILATMPSFLFLYSIALSSALGELKILTHAYSLSFSPCMQLLVREQTSSSTSSESQYPHPWVISCAHTNSTKCVV
jgi:hypothetical protein